MSDQIYIDTMKEQIANGMYDHLFVGRSDLVFLDIGANIGLVSIYAYEHCKRIVAIEPAPDTYLRLVEATKDFPMIECYNVALAPRNEDVEFFVNDINFTASSTVNTYGTRTMVKGQTLSKILDYHRLSHVDVVKCDAEGAEGESLTLIELDLAKDIVDTWYIEMHNCPVTTWENKLGRIATDLARLGYHKMSMSGMALTATK